MTTNVEQSTGLNATFALNQNYINQLNPVDIALRATELQRLQRQEQRLENSSQIQYRFDPIPCFFAEKDWESIHAYIEQISHLCQNLLHDLLHEQQALITDTKLRTALSADPLFQVETLDLYKHAQAVPTLLSFDVTLDQQGCFTLDAINGNNPKGLGVLLQQRLLSRRLLSDAFSEHNVARLLPFLDAMQSAIADASQHNSEPNIVMLAGTQNDCDYDEQLFLAMYLGFKLVHSGDLTNRDGKIWLKTLSGLEQVDIIVRWPDSTLLDPLEHVFAATDSVVGLCQAIRSNNVTVINPLTTGLLKHASVVQYIREQLPQFPQMDNPLQLPFWEGDGLSLKPVVFRCFSLVLPNQIIVLPSALVLQTNSADEYIPTKDVWVQTAKIPASQPIKHLITPLQQAHYYDESLVSRTAENLFWLGNLQERCESHIRFLRLYMDKLSELPMYPDIQNQEMMLLLQQMLKQNSCIYPYQALNSEHLEYTQLHAAKTALINSLQALDNPSSFKQVLQDFTRTAWQVRDLLVQDGVSPLEHIGQAVRWLDKITEDTPKHIIQAELDQIMGHLLTFEGALQDVMSQQNGQFMLSFGRRIARSEQLLAQILACLCHDQLATLEQPSLHLLLQSQQSSVTFKRRYRLQESVQNALELMLLDIDYPRSLAFQIETLMELSAQLPKTTRTVFLHPFEQRLLKIKALCHSTPLVQLASIEGGKRLCLEQVITDLQAAYLSLREAVQTQYFTHTELQDTAHRQAYGVIQRGEL